MAATPIKRSYTLEFWTWRWHPIHTAILRLFLCALWRHVVRRGYILVFPNLGTRWKRMISFMNVALSLLFPGVTACRIHWLGGWMNVSKKRHISYPFRESNCDSTIFQSVGWQLLRLSHSGYCLINAVFIKIREITSQKYELLKNWARSNRENSPKILCYKPENMT